MRNSIAKILSAFVMAAVLTCTGVVAQADEVVDTEYSDTLSIESCAAHIKSVYKAKYPEQTEMIDDIVDTLSNSDEFIRIFEDEGATAFQIIEDSLRDAIEPRVKPYMQTDDLYTSKYVFPDIQQKENYYCGPASVLMALIGSGAKGYYYTLDESITDGWQDTLAKEELLNTTPENGTHIQNITKVLRNNVPSINGYTYKTKAFTINSYKKALDFIETSLVKDAVPVIKVSNTALLDYYYGKKFSHYMVVDFVDFNAESIQLVDPHNDDAYFGSHSITFDEFEYLAKNSKDFWVSVYTDVSSNNEYEYV